MEPLYKTEYGQIYCGDCIQILRQFNDESINCCITSPPYWNLRNYNTGQWVGGNNNCKHKNKNNICQLCGAQYEDRQLGIEKDYNDYIKNLNEVFNQIQRVLRKDGSLWVVINDTYLRKNKSLALIPQRLMIELFNSGWIIRNNIIWQKTCPLPQSAKDRFTINYEYVIFCVKNKKYYFKTQYQPSSQTLQSVKKRIARGFKPEKYDKLGVFTKQNRLKYFTKVANGELNIDRLKRSVWLIPPAFSSEQHYAVFPTKLIETPLDACCPPDGIVIDPFFGTGTTAITAIKQGKRYIGVELNRKYCDIAYNNIMEFERNLQLELNMG